MTKTTKYILIISITHFGLYMMSFLISFSSGMDHALDGTKINLIEMLSARVSSVLEFPLMPIVGSQPILKFPGLWGYFPIILNSLVWAFCLYFGCKKIAEIKNT